MIQPCVNPVGPVGPEAVWLLTKGALAFARVTQRGIPVDTQYCLGAIAKVRQDIVELQEGTWANTPGGDLWRKTYGMGASLGNATQVKHVLFDLLGLEAPEKRTAGGDDSTGKDALQEVDHPLATAIVRYRTLYGMANTFLANILAYTVDGRLHPGLHLNISTTYRSSSSSPNMHNMPIRDPEAGSVIRRAFRAPKGWSILEADYSQLEVRVAASVNGDPVMMRYIHEDYDYHSEMAQECFCLTPEELKGCKPRMKDVRHSGKNDFVFPEFYGSYWKNVGPSLWQTMRTRGFTLADGTPFQEHLRRKGITGRGDPGDEQPEPTTFLAHIQKVERRFWGERFRRYDQWKREFYDQYCRTGCFVSPTGFRYSGFMRKNDVCNYPIQGSASHCKLLGLITLESLLERSRLRGYPILEIHDSILNLCPIDEVEEYSALLRVAMVDAVKRRWSWVTAPLDIEVEASPDGGSWYEKKKVG